VTAHTDKVEVARTSEPPAGAADRIWFDELWKPEGEDHPHRGPERILLDSGVITAPQLEQAVQHQQTNPRLSVLESLVQLKAITEVQALEAVAEYFMLPFHHISAPEMDREVFSLLPVDYLKAKLVLPIRREQDDVVVGIVDPADIFLIDDLKRRMKLNVQLVVVPRGDILRAIEELSVGPGQQVEDIIKDIAEDTVEVVTKKVDDIADLEKIAGESPVIRYVNYLISSAVKEGASDIHIEPGEKQLRIRYRIDGILFEQQAPPLQMHAAIISRLKIMGNLDISERRLPQDGRIRAAVRGRPVDLRVSTLPTTHGEKCVIRILDNRSIMVGLENLGLASDTLEAFRKQISQPHGIVLVTGPTGSGKSTTLYSALQVMDAKKLNISTVEDPVEYELSTINQVNVRESIGMTFSAALRSLLRQDPDIIMIGEIRDEQTARTAVQASLTGHMVLSTLHTNDAPSSITRLINIGIEPFLIAAAVNAIIAQRLVRRICANCKAPLTEMPERMSAYMEKHGVKGGKVFHGTGCAKCRQTGYKGRLGIYELLEIDETMRDMITASPDMNVLRKYAIEQGMRPLSKDGLLKVEKGLTTVEELLRVTET
jgi:type IV pilus assembly protein PilB